MVREMLQAVTGVSVSAEEMLRIGERNYCLVRIFAERAGYTRRDDRLPNRFFRPLPESGYVVDERMLEKTIDEYYELFGYGTYGPKNDRLAELGMGELMSPTTTDQDGFRSEGSQP